MSLRLYLDTSVYNRPFDDQTQPRIWLETLAFSIILQLIEDEIVTLITSSVVAYENSHNPDQMRQDWVDRATTLASETQLVDPDIGNRARALEQQGLKALAALHLASDEAAKADYFVTVDDRLIKRYQRLDPQDQHLITCDTTEFVRTVGETR